MAASGARERSTLQIMNCLLVVRSVPVQIRNEVCCVGMARGVDHWKNLVREIEILGFS